MTKRQAQLLYAYGHPGLVMGLMHEHGDLCRAHMSHWTEKTLLDLEKRHLEAERAKLAERCYTVAYAMGNL